MHLQHLIHGKIEKNQYSVHHTCSFLLIIFTIAAQVITTLKYGKYREEALLWQRDRATACQ